METLVINVIIGFWLVLFGAMAIFPFILESKPSRRTPIAMEEDQVISIQPVATRTPFSPVSMPAPEAGHREAA